MKLSLINYGGIFEIGNILNKIDELSHRMAQQGFWDNQEESNRIVKQLKQLKNASEPWQKAFARFHELKELSEILRSDDIEFAAELKNNLVVLTKDVGTLEFSTLLDQEFDANSAILSINSGAGGTESCDWADMLLRMYTRWAENRGYAVKLIDVLYGEEAGIKNVTLMIEGDYVFGYLKTERGVHRLVRISPFDANKRRHTSFVSVDVIPEIEDAAEIVLNNKDLLIETYRSSGPGGQHMQKTDSAVRITHIPTGIVAQCQNERSQHQNKQNVLKIIKARLYVLEQQKKEAELAKHGTEKKKIEWGSQIRSYVMHPYTMVKDHRSDYETGDVNKVMDGGIDPFIEAYLRSQKEKS